MFTLFILTPYRAAFTSQGEYPLACSWSLISTSSPGFMSIPFEMIVFVVAKPRIGGFTKLFGRQNVLDHRSQNRQGRATDRSAVQVDVIRRQQPLPAHLRPIPGRVGRVQVR